MKHVYTAQNNLSEHTIGHHGSAVLVKGLLHWTFWFRVTSDTRYLRKNACGTSVNQSNSQKM